MYIDDLKKDFYNVLIGKVRHSTFLYVKKLKFEFYWPVRLQYIVEIKGGYSVAVDCSYISYKLLKSLISIRQLVRIILGQIASIKDSTEK